MDLKLVGYTISTVSVLFLGVVAWPKPDEPRWIASAVAVGMATSIIGMGCFVSHLHDKKDIDRASKDEPPKH